MRETWGKQGPVCLILALAAAWRIIASLAFFLVNDEKVFHTPDTVSYLRPALGLVSSGNFAVNGTPEILRTPGYPILLVPGLVSGRLELTTILLQIGLSALTVYVVFEMSLLLFSRRDVAVLCALLYAVEPLSILYSSLLTAEALFTFCIAVSLYLILRFVNARAWSDLLGGAVVLSASVYVRPIAYFLPILFFLILLIWVFRGTAQRLKAAIQVVTFFVVSALLICSWQVRNYYLTGYYKFSAAQDYNMYFHVGASVLAQGKGLSVRDQQALMGIYDWEAYFRKHPEQVGWNSDDVFTYMGQEGVRLVASHPLEYLKSAVKGPLATLLGPGLTPWLALFKCETSSQRSPQAAYNLFSPSAFTETVKNALQAHFWGNLLLGGLLFIYLALCLTALLFGGCTTRKNLIGVVILVLVAAYLVVVPLNMGHSRFRHPAMPIICVLAGCGLSCVIGSARRFLGYLSQNQG